MIATSGGRKCPLVDCGDIMAKKDKVGIARPNETLERIGAGVNALMAVSSRLVQSRFVFLLSGLAIHPPRPLSVSVRRM